MSETFNLGHVWEQERTCSVALPGNWSSKISLHEFKITVRFRWQAPCGRCVNRMKYMDFTWYVFWYMSPTFLHTATCELHETETDFPTEIIAIFWLYGGHWSDGSRSYVCKHSSCSHKPSKVTDPFKAADSSEEDAHSRRSPRTLCVFAIKLIYYDSRPTPIHALISICSVVGAVCSNLLLF